VQLHKAKREYGCEINIAPLIDVVFLLIIFFLTVSHIARIQVEPLELPEAQEGKKADPLAGGRLIVNVHRDGRVAIAGQTHSLTSIRQLLVDETGREDSGPISILIRGDREASWEKIRELMNVCTDCGIGQVDVAVIEPGQKPSDL